MVPLKTVILPAKVLAKGRHKIRISVAHNGETKYIPTDIIIDSSDEFQNGFIVKRKDAAFLNTKIINLLNKYQSRADEIEYINTLTCGELVSLLKNKTETQKWNIIKIFEDFKEHSLAKQSSLETYSYLWRVAKTYLDGEKDISKFTKEDLHSLYKSLLKQNYATTTIRNVFVFLKVITNYAIYNDYVVFRKNPWLNFKLPANEIRNAWISVDKMKEFRDMPLKRKGLRTWRDFFFLSFYLGGMNKIDMSRLDFKKVLKTGMVSYKREKGTGYLRNTHKIEFKLPDEARSILTKYSDGNGKLFNHIKNKTYGGSFYASKVSELLGVHIIFYTARKMFSQIAFELGIHTIIIDHILGHKSKSNSTSLINYVYITPEMATDAIRKVLDFIK